MSLGFCSGDTGVVVSITSSLTCGENASSHFSLETSTPPVLSALRGHVSVAWRDTFETYPANEPPTQANNAGENAGALPAFAVARADADDSCGAGLLRMAVCETSGRSAA